MSALLLTDLAGSVIVIIGAVAGAVRLLRGLGRWIARLGDNTTATEKLTEVVSELKEGVSQVLETLRRHEQEITDLREAVTQIKQKEA